MCGRYTLSSRAEDIARAFEAEIPSDESAAIERLALPLFNIAPTQLVPIVRSEESSGARILAVHRFGLIPGFAKDRDAGARMINARSETVAEKPAFRASFRRRRCIVPMTGFFEWPRARKGGPPRQPTWFHPSTGGGSGPAPLWAAAGVWDVWREPGGELVPSFAILTTAANDVVARVHDRMPVLLDAPGCAHWLDARIVEPAVLAPLLGSWPSAATAARRVSSRVNDPRARGEDLLREAGAEGESLQGSLFD